MKLKHLVTKVKPFDPDAPKATEEPKKKWWQKVKEAAGTAVGYWFENRG